MHDPKIDRQLWEHATTLALRAGHALRQKLGLDEDSFRFFAAYSHKSPRNVYLYRTIDELQKAATCLMRWREFSSDEAVAPRKTDAERQMMRIAEQAVYDEQALRCRKVTESLVDTILFLTTNDDIYFRDYFYFCEFVEYQAQQKDREEFYAFTSRNSQHHIEWLRKGILSLETSGIDVTRRWYLRQQCSIASMKDVALSSFRARYKKIAAEQGPEIMTVLAMSYGQAYGESRDIHFSAGDTSWRFTHDSLAVRTNRIALLMLSLIVRLQDLSLMDLGGPDDPLSYIRANLAETQGFQNLTSPPIRVGDYVLVGRDLCQVIEERKSKYGFFSYHVRYVNHAPMPNIPDDWFASFQLHGLGSKDELLKSTSSILSKHCGEKIPENAVASIDKEHFEEWLKCSINSVLRDFQRVQETDITEGKT